MKNENSSTKIENSTSLKKKASILREKFAKSFLKKQIEKEYDIYIRSTKNIILIVTLILLFQTIYAKSEINSLEKMTDEEIVSFIYQPAYASQVISALIRQEESVITYSKEKIVNEVKKAILLLRKLNYISFGIVFSLFCLCIFSKQNPLFASIIALFLYVIENLLWTFFMGLEILYNGILIRIAIISLLFCSVNAGDTYRRQGSRGK